MVVDVGSCSTCPSHLPRASARRIQTGAGSTQATRAREVETYLYNLLEDKVSSILNDDASNTSTRRSVQLPFPAERSNLNDYEADYDENVNEAQTRNQSGLMTRRETRLMAEDNSSSDTCEFWSGREEEESHGRKQRVPVLIAYCHGACPDNGREGCVAGVGVWWDGDRR